MLSGAARFKSRDILATIDSHAKPSKLNPRSRNPEHRALLIGGLTPKSAVMQVQPALKCLTSPLLTLGEESSAFEVSSLLIFQYAPLPVTVVQPRFPLLVIPLHATYHGSHDTRSRCGKTARLSGTGEHSHQERTARRSDQKGGNHTSQTYCLNTQAHLIHRRRQAIRKESQDRSTPRR